MLLVALALLAMYLVVHCSTQRPLHLVVTERKIRARSTLWPNNERNTRYSRAGNSPKHLYNLRDNPSRWRGAELTSPVLIREASPRVESLEFCSLVPGTRAQFRLMISRVFRPFSSKLRLKYNSPRILWYRILPLKTDNIDLRLSAVFTELIVKCFPMPWSLIEKLVSEKHFVSFTRVI